ncbi:CRISPR-associated endoribonuclease Cas6, partial [Mesotoga prima]
MRVKLTLSGLKNKAVPRDHFHQLSGLIYAMIQKANPDYSKWLHDEGFLDGSKSFKFFCFSKLIPENNAYIKAGDNGEMIVFTKDIAALYISSPVREIMQHLVDFLLLNREIRILNHNLVIQNAFASTESFESGEELFKCITPIVLSTRNDEHKTPFYLRAYQDPAQFGEFLTKNAREKFRVFSGRESSVSIVVDGEYVEKVGRKSNIRINIVDDIEVFGSVVPVKISGTGEEIAFLYDT